MCAGGHAALLWMSGLQEAQSLKGKAISKSNIGAFDLNDAQSLLDFDVFVWTLLLTC